MSAESSEVVEVIGYSRMPAYKYDINVIKTIRNRNRIMAAKVVGGMVAGASGIFLTAPGSVIVAVVGALFALEAAIESRMQGRMFAKDGGREKYVLNLNNTGKWGVVTENQRPIQS